MVGMLKKAGKVLKAAKKAKETSKFLTRRKTLGGTPKAGYPDWFKRWLKENKTPPGTPGPKAKKKQVEKFVEIRKKTKPAWKKKKFD
jgi:hypothetical protein